MAVLDDRPRPRRGRRIGIALLVVLVVLAGLLAAADRVAVATAERELAKQAAKEMSIRQITSPKQPTATIGGFPFLTQVASGRYESVTINVDQPQIQKVHLDHLKIVATDVRAPADAVISGKGQVTANVLTGTATMGWEDVRSLLDLAGLNGIDPQKVQLTVKDDRVQVRAPVTVAGQDFMISGSGTVTVANGVVRLEVTKLGLESGNTLLPIQGLITSLKRRLSVDIKVPALPYRMTIKTVQPTDTGLLLNAAADNVLLAS